MSPEPPRDAERAIAAPSLDPTVRDRDIAFYQQRLHEDPQSAADRSRLAALLLSRARETASFADVTRAEDLALQSVKLRESHNAPTYALLASARLSKHDFAGALWAARRLVALDSSLVTSRALLAEVLLETGAYDEAGLLFRSVEAHTGQPSVGARLVRWYELTGRMSQARTVARYVARLARLDGGLSREQIAWFQMRVGDLAAKAGDVSEADSAYALGLSIFPGDYRILAGQARRAAMTGDWRSAIAAGESAMAIQLDPATLGLLANAWQALGDTAQARSYAKAMTASALTQPGAIHRAWGLHLVDRGQRLDDVLRRVRRELQSRTDVYGYDLLAWTLHAKGDNAAAATAMRVALSQNTEDAPLAFHASEIARALGDTTEANRQLQHMHQFNPRYVPPGGTTLPADATRIVCTTAHSGR